MNAHPRRRRIVLMRHGSVDYFDGAGRPVHAESVELNSLGRAQADAAGALFGRCGLRFDVVVVSGLPRTLETARRVLGAAGQTLVPVVEPAWQEIRGGRLADIPPGELDQAFLGAFQGRGDVEAQRFLGGETVGALLDRVLPPWRAWCERTDWERLLLVLHGGVNRALLSTALAGHRAFFGALEQSPGCINLLDVGPRDDVVVRATNLAPTQWLHQHEQLTTMEQYLAQYREHTDAVAKSKALPS